MRRFSSYCAGLLLLCVSGCTAIPAADEPGGKHGVSLVNKLSWINGLSGQPDGLRSAWPLRALQDGHTEYFPLAQIKQCAPDGECHWGVLKASRSIDNVKYLPSSVQLDLWLTLDIDRRQEVKRPDANAAIAIPADVPALRASSAQKRTLNLEYGKVQHIAFEYGVAYYLCVTRLDKNAKPFDHCSIPHE